MATKTYIRGFERLPVNTLSYAASTNYFLSLAEAQPDYGTFVDIKIEYFNNAAFIVIIYNTI